MADNENENEVVKPLLDQLDTYHPPEYDDINPTGPSKSPLVTRWSDDIHNVHPETNETGLKKAALTAKAIRDYIRGLLRNLIDWLCGRNLTGVNIDNYYTNGVYRVHKLDNTLTGDFPDIPDYTGYLKIYSLEDVTEKSDYDDGLIRIRQILYPDDKENFMPWTRVGINDDNGQVIWSPWSLVGGGSDNRKMLYMHQDDVPYISCVCNKLCIGLVNFDLDDTGNRGTLYYNDTEKTVQPNSLVVKKCNLKYYDVTIPITKQMAVLLPDPTNMDPGICIVFEMSPDSSRPDFAVIDLGVVQCCSSNATENFSYVHVSSAAGIYDLVRYRLNAADALEPKYLKVLDNVNMFNSLQYGTRYIIYQTTIKEIDKFTGNYICEWKEITTDK